MYQVLNICTGVICFGIPGSYCPTSKFDTIEEAEAGIRFILKMCHEPGLCREMYEVIEINSKTQGEINA